jgi:hypothetical protein
MKLKPTVTTAWLAAAQGKDEFVAAISCYSIHDHWTKVLAFCDHGVFIVTQYGYAIGVVGSPAILRDILTEWRSGKSLPESRHPELRRAIEEISSGTSAPSLIFSFITLGVRQRPKGLGPFLDQLKKHIQAGVVLRHQRVYAYIIPSEWFASYRAACNADDKELETVVNQIFDWTWSHEIVTAIPKRAKK